MAHLGAFRDAAQVRAKRAVDAALGFAVAPARSTVMLSLCLSLSLSVRVFGRVVWFGLVGFAPF